MNNTPKPLLKKNRKRNVFLKFEEGSTNINLLPS